jgi:PAS domain S-box-containing protein
MLPMLPDYRVVQRDMLLEVARAITEELDLNRVLRRILNTAVSLVEGHAGLIALREDDGHWHARVFSGIPETYARHFTPLLADIPDYGDPQRFALPEVNRRLQAIADATGIALRQSVSIPMIVRREVAGVIFIFRNFPTAFTANDRTLLAGFAGQAAIAVQNARLYQQAARETQQLNAVLEGYADGILIMDASHRIQRFNRALAKLTGWAAEEAIGVDHDEVIRWARREPGASLAEAEAGGWPFGGRGTNVAPIYVEGDLLRKDGGFTPAGVSYAAIFDDDGKLANLIADVHDLTKFREAEELKSTFISIISHELKTPVALIKGYAETLQREDAQWDAATVRESLEVITEEADRLTDLIEKLLDASRLQAGALKLNRGEVALDQLATRLVEKFRTQTSQHTLTAEFPPDFPVLNADEERLTQVLTNLLSNALKYSPNGGAVTVRGRVEPEQVIVSVSDDGPGIARADLPRVFERFYRGGDDLTKRVKGTGLGLFLTKAAVEAHAGHIWVESQPGEGTTFSFSLPR